MGQGAPEEWRGKGGVQRGRAGPGALVHVPPADVAGDLNRDQYEADLRANK